MEIGHVITILVSFIVAFLTLQNFFKQKWWERKERIYSETIEKLQEIQNLILECRIDLMNIDKFHFDNESIRQENQINLHNKFMELLFLNDKFGLYVFKLFPYFFRPALEKITDISSRLRGYLLDFYNYRGDDSPIDFDDMDLRDKISSCLDKMGNYLDLEMQRFAFYMKSDLRVNIKYFICGYGLQIKWFWRCVSNRCNKLGKGKV
ncbi:hypothetical protein HMPREF3047_09990 [Neisseria sp. HMSC075C10]|jgi:hypothetical protein|uniref:hypothetical protein n=1 Tax=unclassified Neisseria TaxID=2623750 RepID=UPI0008A0FC5D|nr:MULTISPECIES: hypothetical protein [unclassified Neisseria]OFO37526.1 hypothetical protein HMPREF3047_09990 [Neisseria sp. HMSC075C10]OHQ56851.1 hypothetical protein HMPREF2606_08730 [Neisseria sp. HMSC070H10]